VNIVVRRRVTLDTPELTQHLYRKQWCANEELGEISCSSLITGNQPICMDFTQGYFCLSLRHFLSLRVSCFML
jgi:hypothetical protein